jgi:SAM-dependent methyltransferase
MSAAQGRGPAARAAAEAERVVARFRAAARGVVPRLCPCCGHQGLFTAFGDPPRLDARCPRCGSLERHRLFRLWMERARPFGPAHRVLHFAPERVLGPAIRARVAAYETADLSAKGAPDHVVDIGATGLPAASYDRVVCNHVLEHVDDRRALAEIRRLLVPGGLAVLTTPVVEGWAATHEDASVATPEGRRLQFGQADHLRLYGRDLRDRIRDAGFALSEYPALEPDVRVHGLIRGETLFLAQKPPPEVPA